MKEDILEALSHLRIALVQVDPSDDQIIVQHMRDAVTALERIAGPAHDKSKQIALAGADMALLLQREQSELGHGYTTNLVDYRMG